MSELFVVGISWRTAPVAVREKLAFREEEVPGVLRGLTPIAPRMSAAVKSGNPTQPTRGASRTSGSSGAPRSLNAAASNFFFFSARSSTR